MDVSVAVEGLSDEGVAEALLSCCGLSVGGFYGRKGKPDLLSRLAGYNRAAARAPWLVLIDLDREACVAQARLAWLSEPAPTMCFRVAVTEAEAWLLADRETIATFLGVAKDRIPGDPEGLPDPKAALIRLARRSRRRDVREGLVPRDGSGASVGPTYASDIREFARSQWRPRVAAKYAPSLARCLRRLEELAVVLSSGQER